MATDGALPNLGTSYTTDERTRFEQILLARNEDGTNPLLETLNFAEVPRYNAFVSDYLAIQLHKHRTLTPQYNVAIGQANRQEETKSNSANPTSQRDRRRKFCVIL